MVYNRNPKDQSNSGPSNASGFIAPQHEPLQASRDVEASIVVSDKKVSYMNLPNKGQLTLLCIARMVDPLAATSIQVCGTVRAKYMYLADAGSQTYMFYQLKFFNPSISNTPLSTQAGIVVSSKTAAQVCTGMLWGRLADSEWGVRKAVLMIGLLSAGIAHIGYGFSRNFVSAIAWQVFGGAMSSNVAITRCVVAELNPEKRYRTRALLLLPLFANAGMLLGPLVGGFLSSEQGHGILEGYPYAAPNILIAGVYALAALGIYFGLEETLESLQHMEESFVRRIWIKLMECKGLPNDHEYAAIESEHDDHTIPLTPSIQAPPKRKAKLAFRRIWTRNVICTLLSHFIIAGHLGTFTNLWAIFLSTPVGKTENQHPPFRFTGGLGMQPREVGFALSVLGVIGVTLQLVIYPLLNDRFGTIRIWQGALFVFPIVYILAPFPSLVASESTNGQDVVLVWMAMLFVLLLFVLGRTGVTPATTLLINDCTPHPSVRGTIHTAGTVIGSLSRSIFPIIAFTVFGKGLDIRVVGLGFWCLAGLAVLACVASRWVMEGSNGKEIVLEGEELVDDGTVQSGNKPKR
ncbi:Major facilitator superfamily multidrug transporter mfsB [Hyphodiscus hymeniophilus]|uniref:Major facilitator superfamily multidrug transporter mfsB n=1 Tax=Hyphodiscus hymeniophilus TaxID=353542 RepID=A0A9P6VG67_9HELO|nr:Major facilitator superfamily multidrug transporter mfsB [Hyphodiscus hymeniophilus]